MLHKILETIKPFILAVLLIVCSSSLLLYLDNSSRMSSNRTLPHVAIVQHASVAALEEGVVGMLQGLAKNGFENGKTISIQKFNAQSDIATANDIAAQVTNGSFDLIITSSTPSLQAVANKNAKAHIKHVYGVVTDAASSGVGVSKDDPLSHPSYMTGISSKIPVLRAIKIALQANPNVDSIGLVWHNAEINSQIYTEDTRKACSELGITLLEATIDNSAGVGEAARSLVARGVDALFITGDVVVNVASEAVIAAGKSGRIPVFSVVSSNFKKGTLFDSGADFIEVGEEVGEMAAKVLKGQDIAKIPTAVSAPEKLTFNLTALKDLKDQWNITPEMLSHAAAIIDEAGNLKTKETTPPSSTFIQPTLKKIGLISFAPEEGADLAIKGLMDGLRKSGLEEGKNLEVRRTHAQGEIINIPTLVQNYDNQDVDIILTLTTPVLTGAIAMAKKKPVVFTYVYDPIAAGAGKTKTDHLPYVTGVGSFPPVEDTIKTIQEIVPNITSVGTIYNSSEANSRKVVEVARDKFKALNITLEEVTVTSSSEILLAGQTLSQRGVQAIWVTGDNTVLQGFDAVVKVANDARLPLIINDPEFVGRGALAAVGLGWYEAGFAGGTVASKVLNGAPPASLPFEEVAVKKIVVNDDVASKLGVTFSPSLSKEAIHIKGN